jgi:hypothetical protein
MRSAVLGLFIVVGVARADSPPTPIVLASVTAASHSTSDDPSWKVVATTYSQWCQAKPGLGAGEPFTITLAEPAKISSVELRPIEGVWNVLGSAEVTADGTLFKGVMPAREAGKLGRDTITVALSGAAVKELVIKVVATTFKGNDVNCVDSIVLHTATHPEAEVIYGVTPAAAAALWPSITAIKAALSSCDKKALAAQVGFPFVFNWYTTDNDGMKEKSIKYKSTATLAPACAKKKLHYANDAMKLVEPSVQTTGAKTVDVSEGGSVWKLELDGDHWRLRSFRDG